MVIRDIEFTLRDGRKAIIRSPREEDVPGLIEYLKLSAGETDFLLRSPEECGKYTPEAEKEIIERMNAADNEAMLVCLAEGRLVGNCQITWSKKIKRRHRAEVAIALLRDYWGQGIGSRMFEAMIRIAEENKDILQLELDFMEGNARARALYEKYGFRITGIRPDAILTKDGRLINEYSMMKKLRR